MQTKYFRKIGSITKKITAEKILSDSSMKIAYFIIFKKSENAKIYFN